MRRQNAHTRNARYNLRILVTGFDAKKVLAIAADPRPRDEVIGLAEIPKDNLRYQLAGKTRGRLFRELTKPAPWYVEARTALSERERLALDTLDDYERTARERDLWRLEQRRYRQRYNRRAALRVDKSLRANVEQYRALLDELFGATKPVPEDTIRAAYLRSAGLKHAEIAALLGVGSNNSRQTPGGKPIGPELKIQKRIARERKRQSGG